MMDDLIRDAGDEWLFVQLAALVGDWRAKANAARCEGVTTTTTVPWGETTSPSWLNWPERSVQAAIYQACADELALLLGDEIRA